MNRFKLFLFTVSFVSLTSALCAQAQSESPSWKLYGAYSGSAGSLSLFYSETDVNRLSSEHVTVWTKGLQDKALDKQFKPMSKKLINQVATKIAQYYVPPYAKLKNLTQDELADVVSLEEVANAATIHPSSRILVELDCSDKMYRNLSVILDIKGKNESSSKASEWNHIPPESNMESLATLLCHSKSSK